MIQNFSIEKTEIDGVILIKSFYSDDRRGFFTKDFENIIFNQLGIDFNIVETFYTHNKKGVLRGLHFQSIKEQAKLVNCIKGQIWDVVTDLRKDSPTYKKWIHFDLSEDSFQTLLVPKGCAHGYLSITESIISYKCDNNFVKEYDDGIKWNDNSLNIEWPLELVGGECNIIVSEKDQKLKNFEDYDLKR